MNIGFAVAFLLLSILFLFNAFRMNNQHLLQRYSCIKRNDDRYERFLKSDRFTFYLRLVEISKGLFLLGLAITVFVAGETFYNYYLTKTVVITLISIFFIDITAPLILDSFLLNKK